MHQVAQLQQRKKERKSPGSLTSNSKAVRERFDSNATMPNPVAQARQLSPQRNPFTWKTHSFVQILKHAKHVIEQSHCDLQRLSCKTQKHRNTWPKSLCCSSSKAQSTSTHANSTEKESKSPGSLTSKSLLEKAQCVVQILTFIQMSALM